MARPGTCDILKNRALGIGATGGAHIKTSDQDPSREPCHRNADFPVGASRRLENRRYEAERVHGPDARLMLAVEGSQDCPEFQFSMWFFAFFLHLLPYMR